MKVKYLDNVNFKSTLNRLMHEFESYYWAVAWGTENDFSSKLYVNRDKIRRLVIGSHFYQTDPKLLKRFIGVKTVRVYPNRAGGTFHPKVYLFINSNKCTAIIGSANFTNGALSKNHEACMLIEGSTSDEVFVELKEMIENAWKTGNVVTQEFIDVYLKGFNATKRYRNKLEQPRYYHKAKKSAQHAGLLSWAWDEYASFVRQDAHHSFTERLNLLQEARRIFTSTDTFMKVSCDERRAIAGFLSKGKEHLPGKIMEWGWFGSMMGAGEFKSLIIHDPSKISLALDHIPLTGEVSRSQYDNYIVKFTNAFKGKSRKGGVATASRLLAMKRPDTFICIDKKNKRLLADDIGFSYSTLDFDKYWTDVIVPITESIWWQAERPLGEDGKLWDSRMAMLDSIYYEGEN